jgi:creatinine amidohydrolase
VADRNHGRNVLDLTFEDITTTLTESSTLCLPLGSIEQHGPHLPLNTDSVIAEAVTDLIIARWSPQHDLWRLPLLSMGLSWEHAWAPGTMSLSTMGMAVMLRDWSREIIRALPARNVLFVNGHGGNRGILESIMPELSEELGLNLCAMHLGALMSPVPASGLPEIHAGRDETSLMLALAPHLVRIDRFERLTASLDGDVVRGTILHPGVSWPWSSGDRRISDMGVIGKVDGATQAHGEAIIEAILSVAGGVLSQMNENFSVSSGSG